MDSGRMTGLANATSAKADTTTRKNANKYCHIRGSHRSSECRGGRRKSWDYNHGHQDRYRNPKDQDKRFRRSKSQDKAYKRSADRQGTLGKSLRIQTDGDNGRASSPNTSPENNYHRSHSRVCKETKNVETETMHFFRVFFSI